MSICVQSSLGLQLQEHYKISVPWTSVLHTTLIETQRTQ